MSIPEERIALIVSAPTSNDAIQLIPAPAAGRHIVIHSLERGASGDFVIQYTEEIVAMTTTTAPAKRGRKPGTPNPNGGRHPSTEPKTRVSLTAEAAELLAEFAARVNEARGQATRQDEIASAVIVRYLSDATVDIAHFGEGMDYAHYRIARMIDQTRTP